MRVKGLDIDTQVDALVQRVVTGRVQIEELPQKARNAVMIKIKAAEKAAAEKEVEAKCQAALIERKKAAVEAAKKRKG